MLKEIVVDFKAAIPYAVRTVCKENYGQINSQIFPLKHSAV